MRTLLVDVDSGKGSVLAELLRNKNLAITEYQTLLETLQAVEHSDGAVVVLMHCEFLHGSFTQMAKLVQNPKCKILFYCTDPSDHRPKSVLLLPDDFKKLTERIAEMELMSGA